MRHPFPLTLALALVTGACAYDHESVDTNAEARHLEVLGTFHTNGVEIVFETDEEGGVYVSQEFAVGAAPLDLAAGGDLAELYSQLSNGGEVPEALLALETELVDEEETEAVEVGAGPELTLSPIAAARHSIDDDWFKENFCRPAGVNYSWCSADVEKSYEYTSHRSGGAVCGDYSDARLRVYKSGTLKYDLHVDEGRCRWVQYHLGHLLGGIRASMKYRVSTNGFPSWFAGYGVRGDGDISLSPGWR